MRNDNANYCYGMARRAVYHAKKWRTTTNSSLHNYHLANHFLFGVQTYNQGTWIELRGKYAPYVASLLRDNPRYSETRIEVYP